jgi:uncharacterized protein YbjQ (UPF0145 family)
MGLLRFSIFDAVEKSVRYSIRALISTFYFNILTHSIMIITTTPTVEGRQIVEYHGVVFGEVITGINFVKDFFAGIRNIVGGRSNSYEEELNNARTNAMRELETRAGRLGANAVVGVDIDYEVLGNNNGMLMVTASGTAVTIR